MEQRRYRQKRVREGDLILHVVQPEPALHLVVGGPEIMRQQLDTMIELAALPHVTIQITTYQEVDHFTSAFEYASRIALSPRDSSTFIERLAVDWRSST